MQQTENPSLEQTQTFWEGSQELDVHVEGRAGLYAWVERTLRQQRQPKLKRESKGLVRRHIAKKTGLSRAQWDAADQQVCEDARGHAIGAPTTPVWPALHNSRCSDAARRRSCSRAGEWVGDLRQLETRGRGVRQSAVQTAGGDLEWTPVQFAEQCGLPTAAYRLQRPVMVATPCSNLRRILSNSSIVVLLFKRFFVWLAPISEYAVGC